MSRMSRMWVRYVCDDLTVCFYVCTHMYHLPLGKSYLSLKNPVFLQLLQVLPVVLITLLPSLLSGLLPSLLPGLLPGLLPSPLPSTQEEDDDSDASDFLPPRPPLPLLLLLLHLRRSQEERLRSFFYLSMMSKTSLTGTGRMTYSMTGPEVTTRIIRGR